MNRPAFALACLTALCARAEPVAGASFNEDHPEKLQFIRVSKDGRSFVLSGSALKFTPWGFNYDHDSNNRLLETYWHEEWATVAADFQEMKALGANIVRIHLQVSRFMDSAQDSNPKSLQQLARLLELAEKTGLYLDVTGLGCYDKQDVPQWFNTLTEAQRWKTQARFWEAVARTCAQSPAVFCYDLINEPLVSEDKKTRDWTPGAFGDRFFMQRLTLNFAGRSQKEIARAWVNQMVAAIRKHDQKHLVTVGAIPWALTWPKAKPLFYSKAVSKNLDFVSLHFYPKDGEVNQALKALAVYQIGKPILIEEMFPLKCSIEQLAQFIEGSRGKAAGWIGFYWGKTVPEYRDAKRSIGDEMTLNWLEYFARKSSEMQTPTTRY